MLEIDKLDAMLREAGIPFERHEEDLRSKHDYWKVQIVYPKTVIKNGWHHKTCSVIQGTCTYGGNLNLLEMMGLLTPEEEEYDCVCGYLTAKDVFERIKNHWEGHHG